MFFDDVRWNLLLILGLILVAALVNYLFNRKSSYLLKYANKLKFTSDEIIKKYNEDNDTKLDFFGSSAFSDMDSYITKNDCLFINARVSYSKSLYTLARTILFCSKSKLKAKYAKKFNFFNNMSQLLNVFEVIACGFVLIGILLMNVYVELIGLIILLISLIMRLVFLKMFKENINYAIEYLKKIVDEKEIKLHQEIYNEELLNYLFSPLLSLVRIVPFLQLSHQKRYNNRELHRYPNEQK